MFTPNIAKRFESQTTQEKTIAQQYISKLMYKFKKFKIVTADLC